LTTSATPGDRPTIHRGKPDIHILDAGCITLAREWRGGNFFGICAGEDGYVIILMSHSRTGVHLRLTPAGARSIARDILKCADDVDAAPPPATRISLRRSKKG
jgi:hypothetical protein